MRLRMTGIVILCLGLFCVLSPAGRPTLAAGPAAAETLTVYNPMGTPPPITLRPQAPRLDTLEGKTLYFVNTGFIGGDRLMAVMSDWFKSHYPGTRVVYKESGAGVSALSPALWDEITREGDAAIVGLGH